MRPIHQTFAVGRLGKNGRRVIVLDPVPAPIRGPWELRAIVTR
jgi:hypothetical protein